MADMVSKNYLNILQQLKERIRQARLRAVVAVNNELLAAFWEIGNTIRKQEKAEGWGNKTVERLANDLKTEFPDINGLFPRNLRYMREFVLAYPKFTILQRAIASCWINQSSPEKDYFMPKKQYKNGWTRPMLVKRIA